MMPDDDDEFSCSCLNKKVFLDAFVTFKPVKENRPKLTFKVPSGRVTTNNALITPNIMKNFLRNLVM